MFMIKLKIKYKQIDDTKQRLLDAHAEQKIAGDAFTNDIAQNNQKVETTLSDMWYVANYSWYYMNSPWLRAP